MGTINTQGAPGFRGKVQLSENEDEKKTDTGSFSGIELEMPPVSDPTIGGAGGELFGAESLATVSAKLHIAEAFLRLAAKDCKFNDFSRELLLTVMKVVKSEAGSLMEFDPKRQALFFRAIAGASSDKVANFVIPMGQGIVGHVAESRQPLAVSNAEENKIHLKSIDAAVGFTTRNLVALPIIVRGQLYGVLELLNRIGDGDYTKQDVELLTYCTEMAGKALEVRFMIAWALRKEAA
jgi:GAF domain-containing protein